MKFDPARVKLLRERKKFTKVKLAKLVGRDVRTIRRWENTKEKMTSASDDTVINLASVFDVEISVLTENAPLPKLKYVKDRSQRSRIGADVSSRSRNAFMLLASRYGVTQTQVIELAPLLFTLIAEGSLDYRSNKIEKARQHIDALNEMAQGVSSYLHSNRAQEGVISEQKSIAKRDIFGEHVGENAYELDYNQPTENPFFEYLKHLADALTNKAAAHLDDIEDFDVANVPLFTLFHDQIHKLTNGDEELAKFVAEGMVDLGRLPKDLRSPGAGEKRVEWIRHEAERVKEEGRMMLAELEI